MYEELRMSLPATSLIICSRNRPELLADTVESILQSDQVPTELIIVDQSNLRHPTLERLETDRACAIRYIWTQSVGLSKARNLGIAASDHEILVFTDDDVFVAPDWFHSLVRALLKAGPRSVVTGQVHPHVENPGGFQLALKVDDTPAVYEQPSDQDVLYPLNMAMYRSAIEAVGNFDVRLGTGTIFPGGEDNDFGYRLLKMRYRIIYVPQAMLYHRAWRPKRDYVPLRWSYGVGRGGFYAKHLSLYDRYTLRRLVRDVRIHAVQSIRRLRHDRQRAWGDAALVGGILFGVTRWLLTRRKAN